MLKTGVAATNAAASEGQMRFVRTTVVSVFSPRY